MHSLIQELAEEHEALIQEKSQSDEDVLKLETKLHEILHKYETEARKQHDNFKNQHLSTLPPEAKKVSKEKAKEVENLSNCFSSPCK